MSVYWKLEKNSVHAESVSGFLLGYFRKQTRNLIEVAMLTFVGPYSQHLSLAGSPFIRRGMAYFHVSIEVPPQICSSLPYGTRMAILKLIQLSGLPQAHAMLREAFFVSATKL